MVRNWFDLKEHEGALLLEFLTNYILNTGLEPVEPPSLLPPMTPEVIRLICWVGIESAVGSPHVTQM